MMEGHENYGYLAKSYLPKLYKQSSDGAAIETDKEVTTNDPYDNGISISSEHPMSQANELSSDHFQFFNHEHSGLGLMYEKVKTDGHEHLNFEMYRLPFPNYDGHTSAPAAVYEPLVHPESNQDTYYHNVNYRPESEHKDWSSHHHLMDPYLSGQESLDIRHIDPAVIECVYSEYNMTESAQTFHTNSTDFSPSKKSRPTNIIIDESMDRQTVKRLRNRVSASRCRMKKKVWITDMEEKFQGLQEENAKLCNNIGDLEDSIDNMRDFLDTADQD